MLRSLGHPNPHLSTETGQLQIAATVVEGLRQKYPLLTAELDARGRRLWAARESLVLGHGGVKAVVEAPGLADNTVRRGRQELRAAIPGREHSY